MITKLIYVRLFSSLVVPKKVKNISIKNIDFYINDVMENDPNSKLTEELCGFLDSNDCKVSRSNFRAIEALILESKKFYYDLECVKGEIATDQNSVLDVNDFYYQDVPNIISILEKSNKQITIKIPKMIDKAVSSELIDNLNNKLRLYRFKHGFYIYLPKPIFTFVYNHSEKLYDISVYYNRILSLFYDLLIYSVVTAYRNSSLIEGSTVLFECTVLEKQINGASSLQNIYLDNSFYEDKFEIFEDPVNGLIVDTLTKINDAFLLAKSSRLDQGYFESIISVSVTVIKNQEDKDKYYSTRFLDEDYLY